MMEQGQRLYLQLGEEVRHLQHQEWGLGVVEQVMTSSLPGGTCLARVRFRDGELRVFENNLDNRACCYFFGVRKLGEVELLSRRAGQAEATIKPATGARARSKIRGALGAGLPTHAEIREERRERRARRRRTPPGRKHLIAAVAARRKAQSEGES